MMEDAFYYIPLLHSLEIQLRLKSILTMVLNGLDTSQNENVLSDFCDGRIFQNHELFSNDPAALQILLYFDNINLSNPLTNKVHKITFCYQLGNIRKEYRSKLDSIHIFAVCRTSYIWLYELNSILEPLVKELKSLCSNRGYPFRVFDGHVQLRGAVLALLADTPSSHLAGAFKESVGGARKKCRHCMASFKMMNECFTEEEFTLRKELDHEERLKLIENMPTKFLKEYYSMLFGVNGRSKLEEAPYFNVCQQLPQEDMHIFLEGVILKYSLNFYIKSQRGSFCILDMTHLASQSLAAWLKFGLFWMSVFSSLLKLWRVAFRQELNAVEMEDASLPQGLHVVRPDDVPFFQVHHCYKSGEKVYIPFRQYIFDHP